MKIDLTVPDGRCGIWEIQTFEVDAAGAAYHNTKESAGMSRDIQPGTYKRLLRHRPDGSYTVVMSNTPSEILDHRPFIDAAYGDVLIFGLGLGMVLQALAAKTEITSITAVELDPNVITLSGPHYEALSTKVRILQGDALTYKADRSYDAIWFDIWDDISDENLAQMRQLKRKFAKTASIRMCWAEQECKNLAAEGRKLARQIGNI